MGPREQRKEFLTFKPDRSGPSKNAPLPALKKAKGSSSPNPPVCFLPQNRTCLTDQELFTIWGKHSRYAEYQED